MQNMNNESEEDQECPKSKDGNGHCECWWDGGRCCWCGAEEMNEETNICLHLVNSLKS